MTFRTSRLCGTAVEPRPDPVRPAVPVTHVIHKAGAAPDRATALSIFRLLGDHLSAFERVRRLAFVDALPKTISGKIRRVELRRREHGTADAGPSAPMAPPSTSPAPRWKTRRTGWLRQALARYGNRGLAFLRLSWH